MSEQLTQIFEMMLTLDRKFTTFAQQAGYEFDKEGNATRVAKPAGVVVAKNKRASSFQVPVTAEVHSYMVEKGVISQVAATESQKFIDYFESVGWIVGASKKPMKSWKSAVSTWLTKKAEEIKSQTKRYSFVELASGDHLEVAPITQALAEPGYAADFAALEHQHKDGE